MSKGPWKPETKSKHRSRPPVKPIKEADFNAQPANKGAGIPPPLPPISGPGEGSPVGETVGSPGSGAVVFEEGKIKGGLGKAFCSITQGLAAVSNHFLKNSKYEIEFTPVEPEMGDLWAEFAYPVLKLHLPDLEKNPHLVLVMMTGLILSGKIRIKTKEVKPNARGEINPAVGSPNGNTPPDSGVS